MTAAFDLDAYLQRIGYTGDRRPTLDTLRGLHLAHALTIPFENLNPLLHWPVRLDAASLQRKLVRDGRGGYCFEQNSLFMLALRAMGFSVRGLTGRVLWGLPPNTVNARTHMVLLIDIDGARYMADVGFGSQRLTGPLRLETDIEQPTPHEPSRLIDADDGFTLQSLVQGEWRPLYWFDLGKQLEIDYEVANWYTSAHPVSHFMMNLIVARQAPGRRYALNNHELIVHHLDGPSERRTLGTIAELRDVMAHTFGLTLPDTPELDVRLAFVLAKQAGTA